VARGGGLEALVPHLVWEGVLLVVVIVLAVVVPLVGPAFAFSDLIARVGYLGLIASGLAFSFRTGTPNLAVGALAVSAGAIGAGLSAHSGWPALLAMLVGVIVVTVVGAVAGLLVAALSVPAWAVTIGVAVVVTAVTFSAGQGVVVPLQSVVEIPGSLWFLLFLLVSLGGAALWRVPGVRTALSASRPSADPARWAGFRAGIGALVGITVSSLLAGLGGVGYTIALRSSVPGSNDGLLWGSLAAVLIGGVSVFGRRAGIAGTVLGVVIVQIAQTVMALLGLSATWTSVVTGLLIIVGLGVSRGLESIGAGLAGGRARPAPPPRTT
jgi:ribose/xylose/arabinose/galactoside ABC-type transport system permease subunit